MATRVLICDDHPMFCDGLARALEQEPDFEIVGQAGSLGALRAMATSVEPDLVLLDVELGDGTGIDAVTELGERAAVVMISAHDDPVLVRRAIQRGAVGYIRKDTEPVELLRLVHRAADGKTALSGDMALRVADSLRQDPDDRAFDASWASLSPRQAEVGALIGEGKSNREIAAALCISEGTVKNYVTKVLETLGVRDRTKLAVLLVRHEMMR